MNGVRAAAHFKHDLVSALENGRREGDVEATIGRGIRGGSGHFAAGERIDVAAGSAPSILAGGQSKHDLLIVREDRCLPKATKLKAKGGVGGSRIEREVAGACGFLSGEIFGPVFLPGEERGVMNAAGSLFEHPIADKLEIGIGECGQGKLELLPFGGLQMESLSISPQKLGREGAPGGIVPDAGIGRPGKGRGEKDQEPEGPHEVTIALSDQRFKGPGDDITHLGGHIHPTVNEIAPGQLWGGEAEKGREENDVGEINDREGEEGTVLLQVGLVAWDDPKRPEEVEAPGSSDERVENLLVMGKRGDQADDGHEREHHHRPKWDEVG